MIDDLFDILNDDLPPEERKKALRAAARNRRWTVLVWGPGKPNKGASPKLSMPYKKRLQIKKQIRAHLKNPKTIVAFSEDRVMQKLSENILGEMNKEVHHAAYADIIIILGISRGADLELDHFIPHFPKFRDKMFVFIPKKFVGKKSLVQKEVFDHLTTDQIIGFSTRQFNECNLAKVMSIEAVETLIMKWVLEKLYGSRNH